MKPTFLWMDADVYIFVDRYIRLEYKNIFNFKGVHKVYRPQIFYTNNYHYLWKDFMETQSEIRLYNIS